ncbi:MAG: RagB/SusD family nutrient uptake outer membrane protein [Bacteroidales bacterium]|nr:RagB/SusD family nutrient uptake outer membrane protein [Bacteroidales bacterium]
MKKIFIFFLVFVLFVACTKNLDEYPKSIAAETFYNNPSEVESGLNAIYVPLKSSSLMGGVYQAILESLSDGTYGRGSFSIFNSYELDNTNITRIGIMWQLFYQSIKNANICIQKIPNGKNLTDADKNKYLAEAKFLRGLIYFTMARNWGGVILRTEINMDSINVGRSSSIDTWTLALADLKDAEQNLPDNPRLIGTPSKLAAKTVLAEMYLCLQQWQDARDEVKAVIQSNKFSLVKVTKTSDFNNIYGPEVLTTSEEIFYLKFSRQGSTYGFTWPMYVHKSGDGYHGAGGWYGIYSDTLLNPVIKNWNNNDLRKKFNWYPCNIGLGPNTVLNAKYSDPKATGDSNAGNDWQWYKFSDVLLMYAEAECRVNRGPNASAMDALNQVHRRAYGYDPAQTSPVDFHVNDYDEQNFLELVIKERNYETCFEAKRWLDLKRLGIVKQVILNAKGVTVADKCLLFPIPVVEMSYNKALDPVKDQNPGW